MPQLDNVAHPEILAEVSRRGISRVVHFLTMANLRGVLSARVLLCTAKLPNCKQVRYVYEQNTRERWDKKWTDFVSLSIERINREFFLASQRKRQTADNRRCILCFEPVILTHAGVLFATTNNTYSNVVRGEGVRAFNRLFASTVNGRLRDPAKKRPADYKACWPTDRQAEVLYPQSVNCRHLKQIVVSSAEDEDTVYGMINTFNLERKPEVRHNPDMFR